MATSHSDLPAAEERSPIRRIAGNDDSSTSLHIRGPVLDLLHRHRGRALHIIDPFKVTLATAVEKARAVREADFPLIVLGSTDYEQFDEHMPGYVEAVREASGLPVVLHFPPAAGAGIPMTANAEAVFLPAILNSSDVHFVWKSLLETFARRGERAANRIRNPEAIFSAAFTFGSDEKSSRHMGTQPTNTDPLSIEVLGSVVRLLGFDMVYLYSRVEGVPRELCRRVREQLHPEQLLFVGGGVRSRRQVEEFLDAGVDFVIFGGALEGEDWREALPALLA